MRVMPRFKLLQAAHPVTTSLRQCFKSSPGGYWIASKSDVSDFDNLMPKSGKPDFGQAGR
jgi:hypothetical protein